MSKCSGGNEETQMKVSIINPPNIDSKSYMARAQNRWPHSVPRGSFFRAKIFPTYPLFLAYEAAVLEKDGFKVSLTDAAKENLSRQDLVKTLTKEQPRLVVVEIAAPSLISDLKLVKAIKKELDAHICLIGPHATVFAEEIMKSYPFVDSITKGEYFITLRDLARAIDENGNLGKVRGLVYRQGENIVESAPRPPISSLDDLPFPARHLLDPKDYYLGHYTYRPQIMMMSSLGCPYQCIFCLWPRTIVGHKFRPRDPRKVVDEIEHVIEKYGAREIYFDDDTMNVTVGHMIGIADEIIRRGVKIPWICEMRVDNVTKEMLRKMKKADCVKILFGVESGNQKILDNCKKGITSEMIRETFRLCDEVGIKTHATVMFGLPGETKETIEETMCFIIELESDTIQCSIAQAYPGTAWYDDAVREGSLKEFEWSDFDGELGRLVVKGSGLSEKYVQESIGRMYKRFYVRPKHIAKRIFSIRSPADLDRFLELIKGYFRRFYG